MPRGGDQRQQMPGDNIAGMPGIANQAGRMLCPECGSGLWLQLKAFRGRTHDAPAFVFDPYITQGLTGLLSGQCHSCKSTLTAHRMRQRGKYGHDA